MSITIIIIILHNLIYIKTLLLWCLVSISISNVQNRPCDFLKMSLNIKKFTDGDCDLLLQSYFKNTSFKLINYFISPISSDINGYMGDHLLLKINVLSRGEKLNLNFFLKTLYTKHEISSEFIMSGNMFNKEINGYKFFEKLKREYPSFDSDCVPQYYLSQENSYIILQDLYSSGYKLTKSMDNDHLEIVIRALAKFHAGSLIFEETKCQQLKRKYRLTEDYSEWLEESLYRKEENFLGYKFTRCCVNAVLTLIEFLPEDKISTNELKKKVSKLAETLFESFQPSKQFRNVWCNGNLWLKNFMFYYENDRPVNCKIFDFQLQRYNPPAHDLCDLLYENISRDEKQHVWDNYVNLYYKLLKEEIENSGSYDMNNILTMEELKLSCNMALPYLILAKSLVLTFYSIGPEIYEKIYADEETFTKITFEDRSEFLVDIYKSNENYRKAVNEVLLDVRDQLTNDHLSSYDCYSILRRKLKTTQYKFLDYQILNSGKKCHTCKSNLSLNIKVETGGAKQDLYFNIISNGKNLQNSPFFKEMRIYTKMFPLFINNGIKTIEECFGKCYLSLQNKLLVFDDFTKNNYKVFEFGLSYNYETVLCVIKKLAKFHASSIILENSKELKLNTCFKEEMQETIYNGNNKITTTVKEILKQISLIEKLDFGHKTRILKAFGRLEKNVSPSETYRNVLCHGNLSPKNILIKFEKDAVIDSIFVGFDSYRYNTPAHDLISFLYQATDRKFRTDFFSAIINAYYREMSEILKLYDISPKDIFPHEDFMLSCEAAKEFALTNCVIQLYNILSFQHATPSLDFIGNEGCLADNKKHNLIKKMIECFKDFEELR